jgi:putative endonuclease
MKIKKHSPTQQIGVKAEKLAYHFLKNQGLKIVTRNFWTPWGEIDLIMQDPETIVFIEVRYRQSDYVSSIETIDLNKQLKIIRSAQTYLQKNPTWKSSRFDVIALQNHLDEVEIHWIKDAFQVE